MRCTTAALAATLALCAAAPLLAQDEIPMPVVRAMLFGDMSYVATDRKIPAGFEMGQAVGHVIVSFTDRLNYFGEFSATAQQSGYAFEVERSILRYDFDDAFKLSAGRYHTPIGYWNTAFHHGAWLQTTVSRPEMVKFGSQLIPTHFVGAFAEGDLPAGELGLQYMAGVGNGRSAIISRAGDPGDLNGSKAWTVAISARPAALYGAQIGAGYYRDRVTPTTGAGATEGISSAYFAWQRDRPEFIAEYVHFDHTPLAGGESAHDDAYYAQLAYRLQGVAHQLKPYTRYERTTISANDVIFAPLSLGYQAGVGGLRYDFNPFAALKAEYRREHFQGTPWSNGAYVQASFTVPDLGGDHSAAGHQ